MCKVMAGFDYCHDKPVVRDSREWRTETQRLIEAGGFRRVEQGETYLHHSNGVIAYEVYGYLPAPKEAA